VRCGFLAWLAEGGAFYALHDPSMIMSRYKRGRGRGIVTETIAGWTPVSAEVSKFSDSQHGVFLDVLNQLIACDLNTL